jgi:EPS-associated MarR family transcriptional regulator
MNKINNKDTEKFEILRKIYKERGLTQRKLAQELGYSLGKLNFIVNELRKKGLIKIMSLKKDPRKIRYLLTHKGLSLRTKLTINFMNRKMIEYDELKREIEEKVDLL